MQHSTEDLLTIRDGEPLGAEERAAIEAQPLAARELAAGERDVASDLFEPHPLPSVRVNSGRLPACPGLTLRQTCQVVGE